MTWYEYMADASVRAVALAAMAGVLVLFLRRGPAAQHAVWTLVTLCMLALPALRPAVPAAYVYVVWRPAPTPIATPAATQLAANPAGTSAPASRARSGHAMAGLRWPVYAAIAYIAGALLFAARLMLALLTTRRLLRGARPVDAGVDLRVEESDRVRVPVTIGIRRMRVLLPAGWREWPAEKLKVVLAHESAHARRHDPAIALLAAVNECIFWFHPLAWWLERRLAVLAEHVADDAGLAVAADPGSYARVVLEVASHMQGQTSRLVWNASGMDGQLVARRIERVMDSRRKPGTGRLSGLGRAMLCSSAALLIWISAAVDLQPVARAQAKPSANQAEAAWWGFSSDGGRPDGVTAPQAAEMEQQLAANPEDETTRSKLLHYYWRNKLHDRRIELVLWLIDHHPESALHGYEIAAIFPRNGLGGNAEAFEDARARWLAQVDLHPGDARILGNAARALGEGSVAEEIDLMKRARTLDPAHRTEPLATVYAFVLVFSHAGAPPGNPLNDPALATQIANELRGSSDITLVGSVARRVVEDVRAGVNNQRRWDFAGLETMATEVVARAQVLEPQDRDWADLMEGVKSLPGAAPQPSAAVEPPPSAPRMVRIGAGVAAAMLMESRAPVYPPLALIAHTQGVVKLQVRIGRDGHVMDATLISGNPLLAPAAMDAVRQYVYRPVILQGEAVEASTSVEVAFDPGK